MIIFPLVMLAGGAWFIWKNPTVYVPLPWNRRQPSLFSRFGKPENSE